MNLVIDTGAIIALLDADDRHHQSVRQTLFERRQNRDEFVVPALVLCEVDYVLAREGLGAALVPFLGDVLAGAYRIECPSGEDVSRAIAILTKSDVGLTDATVAAAAERLGAPIATIDRRDFDRLRTSRGRRFKVIP